MFALFFFFGWKRFSCVFEPWLRGRLHQLQPPLPHAIWHFKPWLFPGRALLGHWKQKEKRKRSFSFHDFFEADLQINPERLGLFLTFSKFQLFCWPASLQGAALNQLSLIRPLTPDTPPPGRPKPSTVRLAKHLASTRLGGGSPPKRQWVSVMTGCWSRLVSSCWAPALIRDHRAAVHRPLPTLRPATSVFTPPVKRRRTCASRTEITAHSHNEEMSLQPIMSFDSSTLTNYQMFTQECELIRACAVFQFFFSLSFESDTWLITFSALIKVQFFRWKTKSDELQMRSVRSCVLDEKHRNSVRPCLLLVNLLPDPFSCHSPCNTDAIISSLFKKKQDSLDENPKQICFSRHISVSPLLRLSSLQLLDL